MNGALPSRADVPPCRRWALEDIFASEADWEAQARELDALLPPLSALSGRLAADAETLLAAFRLSEQAELAAERLYAYAQMRYDEDRTDPARGALRGRALALRGRVEEAEAFLRPELLAAPPGKIEGWLTDARFAPYRFYAEKLLRQRPHTRTAPEERLIALTAGLRQAPTDIYAAFLGADLTFPSARDERGGEHPLTLARFQPMLESPDRTLRQSAYEAVLGTLRRFSNTLAAALSAGAGAAVFAARARGFSGARAAALFEDDIPEPVYDGLIEAAHQAVPLLGRYLTLRRRILGVSALCQYDLSAPLFPGGGAVPYEWARGLIAEALAPLGDRYRTDSARIFDERWIDPWENRGKYSGGYSSGCYGVHPFLLMNYQGTVTSLFTLAHEMGHAMHGYYSDGALGYRDAQYPIFLAEIASTTNELLLLRHLTVKAPPEERRFWLVQLLEQFRTTFFRQTLFAEFERELYRAAEEGRALTAEALCGLYGGLVRQYYPDVAFDPLISFEWARVPHFYTPFYVYQYATGLVAAVRFSDGLFRGEPGAQERYGRFLRAGGSRFPLEILRGAGVDMASPEPVRRALAVFGEAVDDLEALL